MQIANPGLKGPTVPLPNQDPQGMPSTLLVNSQQHPLHTSRASLPRKKFYPYLSTSVQCPPAQEGGIDTVCCQGHCLELTFFGWARPEEMSTCTPWFLTPNSGT